MAAPYGVGDKGKIRVGLKQMNRSARLVTVVPLTLGLALAGAAFAQQGDTPVNSTTTLRLPQNPQIFGTPLPSVVKATAIVNGEVITQTDIDESFV
jgi:peptidyl-prolyl cis-trans isomerase SurA